VALCGCVCMSVCMPVRHKSFYLKEKNISETKRRRKIVFSFLMSKIWGSSKWLSPSGDAKYTQSEKKLRLSTVNSLYRENGTR